MKSPHQRRPATKFLPMAARAAPSNQAPAANLEGWVEDLHAHVSPDRCGSDRRRIHHPVVNRSGMSLAMRQSKTHLR
jgi:hypothetical protein